jgi:hypothetical protein
VAKRNRKPPAAPSVKSSQELPKKGRLPEPRYASAEEFEAALDHVMKVHDALFRKLAE